MNSINKIFLLLIIALTGTTIYFAIYKNVSQPIAREKITAQPIADSDKSFTEYFRIYKNEEYGYEIQYPSFFRVDDSKPDNVKLLNNTDCSSNRNLCIIGIDAVSIDVGNNTDGITIDQYYEKKRKDLYIKNLKKIKIFPLPENFNENELIDAIRYEYDAVPKQAKGGYRYIIFKDKKIFTVDMLQGDTTQTAYENGHLINITQDIYDPLGDIMMRTFKFNK